MRALIVLLVLISISCRPEKLTRTFDPNCGQTCYGGETVRAGKGVCNLGTYKCATENSTPVCEDWGKPQEVVCNGLDNDCDGRVDSLVKTCTTACGWGTLTCRDGIWSQCEAPNVMAEVCNGLDDDCDGQVDEALELSFEPCYSGNTSELAAPRGDCHPGVFRCERGRKTCRNEKLPSEETCDNVDNNCNASVDEDIIGCANQTSAGINVQIAWNAVNDIDLHLLHPDAGNSHDLGSWATAAGGLDCFYGNANPEWDNLLTLDDNPSLDRDVIRGVGPETTTIVQPIIGHKYTIGVYSFNYAAAPATVSVSVRVYCGGRLMAIDLHHFVRQGEMWVVGTIESGPSQCTFIPDGHVMP